jgi:hypothetical protein
MSRIREGHEGTCSRAEGDKSSDSRNDYRTSHPLWNDKVANLNHLVPTESMGPKHATEGRSGFRNAGDLDGLLKCHCVKGSAHAPLVESKAVGPTRSTAPRSGSRSRSPTPPPC